MPKITVVNPHHWMNEDGSFPEQSRVRAKMVRVAQFIEYGGPLAVGEARRTLVPCRWRPDGQACSGFMAVLKQKDDAILALCMGCKEDEFLIYEWEDTPWARGPDRAVRVANPEKAASDAAHGRPQPPPATAGDALLRRALAVIGSPMSVGQVRDLISTSDRPTAVLQIIMGSLPSPPTQGAVERFLPVLMNEWNKTPRNDLDGLTPAEKYASASAPVNEGRNRSCPCGSGKKFKRCCISKAPAN